MAPESLLRDPGAFLWFIRIQRARGVGIGRGGEWLCAMWSTGGGTRGFSSRPKTPIPFAVVAFARPSEDCPNLLDRVVRALPPNEPEKRAPRLKTLRQFEDSPVDWEHTPTLVRGSLDGMLSAASIFRNKSLCPIGSSIATAAPMAPESLLRDPGAFLLAGRPFRDRACLARQAKLDHTHASTNPAAYLRRVVVLACEANR